MKNFLVAALAVLSMVPAVFSVGYFTRPAATPSAQSVQTIYVRNVAPQFISNAEIRNDLPAWQAAVNQDVAPIWHTNQVKLVFIGHKDAPKDAITATFVNKGDVKGALAYHTVTAGAPAIIVYAGTDDYYGYSNSVSFTHELEELLADPTISITNQGYSYPTINLAPGSSIIQLPGTVWANEVSDPVEEQSYPLPGADGKPVSISDFVTPNWFNNEVNGSYDFMHLIQQPYTILKGGYAQFWNGFGWTQVTNFRHAGKDAAGFLKGERNER